MKVVVIEEKVFEDLLSSIENYYKPEDIEKLLKERNDES